MNHDAQTTTTTKGRQRIALSQSRDDGMLDGELERNSASSSDAPSHSPSRHNRARSSAHPMHFTIPMYRAGEKPQLKCWCGETTSMSNTHIGTFVHEHEQCKPKAEDETDGT